jgi:hypothetical protein
LRLIGLQHHHLDSLIAKLDSAEEFSGRARRI